VTDVDPAVARRMWHLLEPYHAPVYFASEVRDAMKGVGLKGFWMGYFAGRSAPLGAVGPEVVTALFFGFHPDMVAKALPDAWGYASPAAVLDARRAAVGTALERILGDDARGPVIVEAAELARTAAAGCELAARPLHAAHAGLDWPDEPHLVLWHAATLLREHRGDGHVVALAAEGLDGCSAHVAAVEIGAVPREALQPNRGWSDEEWEAARRRLGGLDLADLRMRVEIRTDRLAVSPWAHLGAEGTERLAALLEPVAERIVADGAVPVPNPMGAPWPPRPLS
jgi:hypothetical protein